MGIAGFFWAMLSILWKKIGIFWKCKDDITTNFWNSHWLQLWKQWIPRLTPKNTWLIAIFEDIFCHVFTIFSKTTKNTEMYYTSLEGSNIKAFDFAQKEGVASLKRQPCPWQWTLDLFRLNKSAIFLGRVKVVIFHLRGRGHS